MFWRPHLTTRPVGLRGLGQLEGVGLVVPIRRPVVPAVPEDVSWLDRVGRVSSLRLVFGRGTVNRERGGRQDRQQAQGRTRSTEGYRRGRGDGDGGTGGAAGVPGGAASASRGASRGLRTG